MLIAGAYIVITHLALFVVVNRGDPVAVMVSEPVFRIVSVAYAAAFAGLLIALFAAYEQQAREGTFGLVALFAAILGTFTLGADMWFEGFATPWLVEVLPQVLTAQKTTIWVIGFFSSYVLFALGWLLFGLASLQTSPSRDVFTVEIHAGLTW